MNKQMINIGNTDNEKIITKELKIAENVFIYNETVIQLCNISRINLAKAPKEPYQIMHIIMVLIGILLLFGGGVMLLVGLLVIGIGGILLYNTYSKNQDEGEYLVLELNSGKNIFLYCKKHTFAVELVDTIINCINSGKEYKISMENCQIESCQFGEGNLLVRNQS